MSINYTISLILISYFVSLSWLQKLYSGKGGDIVKKNTSFVISTNTVPSFTSIFSYSACCRSYDTGQQGPSQRWLGLQPGSGCEIQQIDALRPWGGTEQGTWIDNVGHCLQFTTGAPFQVGGTNLEEKRGSFCPGAETRRFLPSAVFITKIHIDTFKRELLKTNWFLLSVIRSKN